MLSLGIETAIHWAIVHLTHYNPTWINSTPESASTLIIVDSLLWVYGIWRTRKEFFNGNSSLQESRSCISWPNQSQLHNELQLNCFAYVTLQKRLKQFLYACLYDYFAFRFYIIKRNCLVLQTSFVQWYIYLLQICPKLPVCFLQISFVIRFTHVFILHTVPCF